MTNTTLRGLALALTLVSLAGGARAQDFTTFKAHNNVSIDYTVLLPEGYSQDNAYPTAVAFASPKMWETEAGSMIDAL
ncbi:MAG: hypothetical protein ACI80V_001222 [Rhodothermales bacterium]|jgi:hypothetical protein